MLNKWFLCLSLLAGSLLCLTERSNGREVYAIDDTPLMLYKTINWWYDCIPADSKRLCGRSVNYAYDDGVGITYDRADKKITLSIDGGVAPMLLALKQCRQCYGPARWKTVWLNPKYLNGAAAEVMVDDLSSIAGIRFTNIHKAQGERIQDMARDLQFKMEGIIGGLSNGRIALHSSGDLLKRCDDTAAGAEDKYPTTLKVLHTGTSELVALFGVVWED